MFALLVIDQQKGIDHPKLGPRNNLCAETKMLELMDFWRAHQWPVFHIKHRSRETDSVFWPHQQGFDFKAGFEPREHEYVIEKKVPCAFSQNVLDDHLQQLGIKTLVITGVATNNSVEATSRTAGNLGYNAYVVEDACFSFDKSDYFGTHRSANEVHAMSLANLHGEYATVVSASEITEKFT